MPEIFQGQRTSPRRSRLAQFLGQLFAPRPAATWEPSFNMPRLRLPASGLRPPISPGRACASPSEARLAACRRMHVRTLWRRVRRGTWSPTSLIAARHVLRERAHQE